MILMSPLDNSDNNDVTNINIITTNKDLGKLKELVLMNFSILMNVDESLRKLDPNYNTAIAEAEITDHDRETIRSTIDFVRAVNRYQDVLLSAYMLKAAVKRSLGNSEDLLVMLFGMADPKLKSIITMIDKIAEIDKEISDIICNSYSIENTSDENTSKENTSKEPESLSSAAGSIIAKTIQMEDLCKVASKQFLEYKKEKDAEEKENDEQAEEQKKDNSTEEKKDGEN
jgi:hypothetical protein